MDGAAGTSQQGVEVEDIAEVLKDSRGRCDPLKFLISVQGTLFPRFTLRERIIIRLHSSLKLQILLPSWSA